MKLRHILLLLLPLLISSCSKKPQQQPPVMEIDSSAPDTEAICDTVAPAEPRVDAELTDEELKTLAIKIFDLLPDQGDFSPSTRSVMTGEFYDATVKGFDAPGNNPGGIGDEEDLFYWYSGYDGCAGITGDKNVELIERSAASATLEIIYPDCSDEPHKLLLVKRNGKWVAADFDDMLMKFKQFNTMIRSQYAGEGPMQLLEQSDIDPESEIGQEFLREVKRYKKKYHIK